MAASTLGYSLQTTITLPGTIGGHGDWVAYDSPTNTVWLAQSPDNNVVVINAATKAIAATIPNIGNANGIALSPQYAFVADVTNDTLDVINKTNFQVVASVAVPGTTPDSVVYIPSTNEIAVASDDANQEYFYNASTFALTATLQLTPNPAASGPDVATYVAATDLLYQPDDKQVDVINPHTHQIVTSWNLVSTGTVKPGVYDPVTNTFLFGTTNNQMLVVNGSTGAVVSTIAIPGSVDETSIDVDARLAFVGDKSGSVDIINLDTGTLAGSLPATVNAHTLGVNTNNGTVFLYQYNNTVSVYAPTPITTDTMYRYFDTSNGAHFFTDSASEASAIAASRPNLVQESSNFGAVDPASNDPAATAVYRFFDTTNGSHFYTTSSAEVSAIQATNKTLTFEGTAFYEDTTLQAGDRAVYRFFNTQNGQHMFTADLTEAGALSANSTFKAEGVAFYAPSTVSVTS